MKRFLTLITASLLLLSAVPSFADFGDREPSDRRYPRRNDPAALAYQLASLGEQYSYSRNNYGLSRAATELHMTASDLYYALTPSGGHRPPCRGYNCGPTDHRGGYGDVDYLLNRVRSAVDYFSGLAPYGAGNEARMLFHDLTRALDYRGGYDDGRDHRGGHGRGGRH